MMNSTHQPEDPDPPKGSDWPEQDDRGHPQVAGGELLPSGLPYAPHPKPSAHQPRTRTQIEQFWKGPIPSPEDGAQFEQILHGSFDRILSMSEKALDAQISLSKTGQLYLQRDTRRGHYLGALISLAAIVLAALLAYHGATLIASLMLGVPIFSVAKALVDTGWWGQPKPEDQDQSDHDDT